jgi:hypothetical protein
MAFQPINYAAIPLQNGPENITSGFNAAYGPIAAKRKAEADLLAAELLKMQIQNEPQKYETERAYKQAETQKTLQDVQFWSSIMQSMGLNPNSMGGSVSESGGGATGNTGQSGHPSGGIFGPDAIQELIRLKAGLGPQSPAQAQQMAIDTHAQNTINTKNIEQQFPTSAVLTKNQEKIQGIEGLIPLLNKIISNPVPSQAEIPLPKFLGENASISNTPGLSQIWNLGAAGPDENSAYHGNAGLAKDVALKSQGLSSTTENLKTIGHAIERQSGESEEGYKRRIKELVNQSIDEYEHATGKRSNFQRYDLGGESKKSAEPGQSKTNKQSSKYSQSDLEYTAKKYGITVDQAKKILEDRGA